MTPADAWLPIRIQRSRAKGWRMPEGAVYVGRPGVCGNPFQHPDPAIAVRMFRVWLTGGMRSATLFDERLKSIEGKRMLIHRRHVVMRHALPGPGQGCPRPAFSLPVVWRTSEGGLGSDPGQPPPYPLAESRGKRYRQMARLNARSAAIASIIRASAGAVSISSAACI